MRQPGRERPRTQNAHTGRGGVPHAGQVWRRAANRGWRGAAKRRGQGERAPGQPAGEQHRQDGHAQQDALEAVRPGPGAHLCALKQYLLIARPQGSVAQAAGGCAIRIRPHAVVLTLRLALTAEDAGGRASTQGADAALVDPASATGCATSHSAVRCFSQSSLPSLQDSSGCRHDAGQADAAPHVGRPHGRLAGRRAEGQFARIPAECDAGRLLDSASQRPVRGRAAAGTSSFSRTARLHELQAV